MLPDPGIAEQPLETMRFVQVVIIIEHRAKQTFSKPAGAQEDRYFVFFEFCNVVCLVYEIVIVFTYFSEVHYRIRNLIFDFILHLL